ncbi:RnfH family protein [Thiomicrospira microaerophila]|uniref:RnfH family protein n=1 Tax=Thiomicrospira microaerophila TaxID=406020 RepID=UPI00200BD838|nr:RnfH family protein [Thiomicrospira microaerophila]
MDNLISIEVAYGLPEQQFLYQLQLPYGVTAKQAVESSPLLNDQPDLVIEQVGVFSRPVNLNYLVRDGDRIEVYRPLKADPRERRRKQVEEERAESS